MPTSVDSRPAFFLIGLARRHVRTVQGGHQSPTPFVLLNTAADFVLWLAGVLLVFANINST
jgi:hypothetical protein